MGLDRSEESKAPSSALPTNFGLALSTLLVVLLVALPIANSASVLRRDLGAANTAAINYLIPLFVAVLCLAVVTNIGNRKQGSHLPLWPRNLGGGLFISLLVWIFLSHARMGEWNAARNMGFIALTFFVVYISAARGLPIGVLLRNTLRAAALYSLFMWVFRHAWYVNASEYFVDSGKIFSTFPNVYGILSHPNYTALMFGSALVLEFALWARYSSWRLSALFSLISFVILLTTQGRNAIGAAVMGVISVLLYRHGRTGWVSLIVALAFLASWIPFALMIPVYMFGGSPAYGWLSAFTNRGSLWAAILEILPEGILFGKGQAAIFEAHRYVSDSDVSDVTHAHNQVLDLLLVGGLIAGFLYLSLYSVIVSRIASKHAPADGVGLVVVLTFTTITESPLTPYVTQIGVILFIAAIAILFSSNEINSRRTRPNLARPTANDGGPLFRRANHRNTAAKLP